jgi:hypothetical protein
MRVGGPGRVWRRMPVVWARPNTVLHPRDNRWGGKVQAGRDRTVSACTVWAHHAHWVVTMRNHSDYRLRPGHGWVRDPHPSAYSRIKCLECGNSWTTKADYVAQVPDKAEYIPRTERTVSWAACQICGWFENNATQQDCETHTKTTGHCVFQHHEVTTWYYQPKGAK